MRWYVSCRGQTWGPMDEAQVAQLVRSGYTDAYVQGETGGPWLHVYQSPFAAYASQHHAPAVAPAAGGAKKRSMSPVQLAGVLVIFTALALSLAFGWLGIILGTGLTAWAVTSHLRGKRSPFALFAGKPRGLALTCASIGFGLVLALCGLGAVGREIAHRRELQRSEQEQRRRDEAVVQRRKALHAELGKRAEAWHARVTEAELQVQKDPVQAYHVVSEANAEFTAYAAELGQPEPEDVAHSRAELSQIVDRYRVYKELTVAADNSVARTADAKAEIHNRRWLQAEDALQSALQSVLLIDSASDEPKRRVLPTYDTKAKTTEINQLRKSIAPQVAQTRKRLALEEEKRKKLEAEAAAYAALCGSEPTRSGWDGEIVGLESVLERTAHDPDSIDVSSCTPPSLTKDHCWVFVCDVRGKNMFGATILQVRKFAYSEAAGFAEL